MVSQDHEYRSFPRRVDFVKTGGEPRSANVPDSIVVEVVSQEKHAVEIHGSQLGPDFLLNGFPAGSPSLEDLARHSLAPGKSESRDGRQPSCERNRRAFLEVDTEWNGPGPERFLDHGSPCRMEHQAAASAVCLSLIVIKRRRRHEIVLLIEGHWDRSIWKSFREIPSPGLARPSSNRRGFSAEPLHHGVAPQHGSATENE